MDRWPQEAWSPCGCGRAQVWFWAGMCGHLEHWQRVGDELVCEEGQGSEPSSAPALTSSASPLPRAWLSTAH